MTKRRTALLLLLLFQLFTAPVWARPPVTAISADSSTDAKGNFMLVTPAYVDEIEATVDGKRFVFLLSAMTAPSHPGFSYFTGRRMVYSVNPIGRESGFADAVIPYLNRSKEFQDMLKLRSSGRQIRAKYMQNALKKEASKPNIRDIIDYLTKSIGNPLLISDKAPIPEYFRKPGAGPCNISTGAGLFQGGDKPLACLDGNIVCITDLVTNSGEIRFDVMQAIKNDTFDVVLCHETAHAIMSDLLGFTYSEIKRPSENGHSPPIITDRGLAWIEGWAEAFEAVYGPANPKFTKKEAKKLRISEFLFERQDPLRRERYIWESLKGKPTGRMKNSMQMLATEGVIAGIIYDILTNRAIAAPAEKFMTAMAISRPQDFQEAMNALLKHFPGDRRVLLRVFLENTNYVTMDRNISELYLDAYQKKVAFTQKKLPREKYLEAKKAFIDRKEQLFAAAMKGADIFANIGPELWFSGLIKSSKPKELSSYEKAQLEVRQRLKMDSNKFNPNIWEFNLDLNTITERMLTRIGVPENAAKAILADRHGQGFYKGDPLVILKKHMGEEAFAKWKSSLNIRKMNDPAAGDAIKHLTTLYPEDFDQR